MQFQTWDFLYEIGRINTGEKTYRKIFITSLHSLYMPQLFKQCVLLQTYPFTCCLVMLGLRRSNHAFPFASWFLSGSASRGRHREAGVLRVEEIFCLSVSPLQHSFTEGQHILSSGFLSNTRASLIKDILLWILNHNSVGSILWVPEATVMPKQCSLSAKRSESWFPWGFFSKILIFNNSKLLFSKPWVCICFLHLLLHDTPVFLFPFSVL